MGIGIDGVDAARTTDCCGPSWCGRAPRGSVHLATGRNRVAGASHHRTQCAAVEQHAHVRPDPEVRPPPAPRAEHPGYGVWYGASSPRGRLAEAFQSSRVIDRHRGDPYLTGLRFTRPLSLLDVSGIGEGTWATRVGGNHALDSAAHDRTQHWARTIHRAHDDLDGIVHRGRFAGSVCIVITERAADAFPALPAVSLPLSHPGLSGPIDNAAYQLGYAIT